MKLFASQVIAIAIHTRQTKDSQAHAAVSVLKLSAPSSWLRMQRQLEAELHSLRRHQSVQSLRRHLAVLPSLLPHFVVSKQICRPRLLWRQESLWACVLQRHGPAVVNSLLSRPGRICAIGFITFRNQTRGRLPFAGLAMVYAC